jgi:hypothetical protein
MRLVNQISNQMGLGQVLNAFLATATWDMDEMFTTNFQLDDLFLWSDSRIEGTVFSALARQLVLDRDYQPGDELGGEDFQPAATMEGDIGYDWLPILNMVGGVALRLRMQNIQGELVEVPMAHFNPPHPSNNWTDLGFYKIQERSKYHVRPYMVCRSNDNFKTISRLLNVYANAKHYVYRGSQQATDSGQPAAPVDTCPANRIRTRGNPNRPLAPTKLKAAAELPPDYGRKRRHDEDDGAPGPATSCLEVGVDWMDGRIWYESQPPQDIDDHQVEPAPRGMEASLVQCGPHPVLEQPGVNILGSTEKVAAGGTCSSTVPSTGAAMELELSTKSPAALSTHRSSSSNHRHKKKRPLPNTRLNQSVPEKKSPKPRYSSTAGAALGSHSGITSAQLRGIFMRTGGSNCPRPVYGSANWGYSTQMTVS